MANYPYPADFVAMFRLIVTYVVVYGIRTIRPFLSRPSIPVLPKFEHTIYVILTIDQWKYHLIWVHLVLRLLFCSRLFFLEFHFFFDMFVVLFDERHHRNRFPVFVIPRLCVCKLFVFYLGILLFGMHDHFNFDSGRAVQ